MKKLLLFLLPLFLFYAGFSQNACDRVTSPHLRLMGDSWMQFPVIYQAYDSALAKYGFPDYYSLGEGTAVISTTGEGWWQERVLRDALTSAMNSDFNKPIDVVMVSLGGNGVAFEASHNDSASVLDPYLYKNKLFMDSIFDFIHKTHPKAQIIWQCYDYPNFLDPLLDYPWDPYMHIWESHGECPPYEIDKFLIYITKYMDSVTQAYHQPYMHFFNCLGLMQWIYGQPTPLRTWPGGTYPPRSVPFPGGNPEYPSPHAAMGLNGLDTYHLGPKSYTELAEFYMRKFISDYLRRERDTTIHSDGGVKDGWVTSGNQSGTGEIQVAKNGTQITKGIVSFNTGFIAGRKIKKASLFIKNKTISKKYPLSDVFPSFYKLDIVKGTFGNGQVETADYSAPASGYDVACVAGNLRGNEYTLRFDLRDDALQYINTAGETQFRVEITDDNLIRFYNGDTTDFEAPYLDIYYDTSSVTGIFNKKNTDQNLQVFPNPAKDQLELKLNKEWLYKKAVVTIYNTQGAVVTTVSLDKIVSEQVPVDIRKLAAGSYVIAVESDERKSAGTFVKASD